jgi:hypothetical protein
MCADEKSAHNASMFPSPDFFALLVALSLFCPQLSHAQGCTQCLDNTAATPPATQRAYRRAIILLTLTAGGLFATTLILFKRHR